MKSCRGRETSRFAPEGLRQGASVRSRVYTNTISFTSGQDYDAFEVITIPDDVTEANETLKITLSNPVNLAISSDHGSATASILDDDSYGITAQDDAVPTSDGDYPYWTFDQEELDVSASQGVLLNDIDYDPNAQPNGLQAIPDNDPNDPDAMPKHGTVNLRTDGSFVFIPTPGYAGLDSFKYRARSLDGRLSAPAVVFVAVVKPTIEANAHGSWGWSVIGGGGTVVVGNAGLRSAWVGQAVDLRAGVFGPPVKDPWGTNPKFTWDVGGKVVAGYKPTTDSAKHIPFDYVVAALAEPTAYWVDSGVKAIKVTVKDGNFPSTFTVSTTGGISINRPKVDVTSTTDQVRIWNDGVSVATVQLGSVDITGVDPNQQHAGILFTRTDDATARGVGMYQWVQLVKGEYHRSLFVSGQLKNQSFKTDDWWLDGTYPYNRALNPADPAFLKAGDSPKWGFEATVRSAKRDDSFQMFLMWKFGSDPDESSDSIWVPLRLTSWASGFTAHRGPNAGAPGVSGWIIDTSYPLPAAGSPAKDPPSQDTTNFPEWTKRLDLNDPQILKWRDDP